MTAPLSLHEGGSLYERIGPDALAALVTRFYARVARDPDLWVIEIESRDGRTLLDQDGLD